jgi:serine O-acetyltransferase
MAHFQTKASKTLDKVDPVWARVRSEAEEIARNEPELATFIYENMLHHDSLEAAVAHRVSQRLDHSDVSGDLIRQAFHDALGDEPTIGDAFRADIVAVVDRDPATLRFIEPVLYYKGFHAIQAHRLAHWLLRKGRKDFALYLQSRASVVFQCDINPAAKIGRGVMIGAGAKILGNVEVGHCARIAAGSVVLKAVPPNTTVAGVPAKVVGEAGCPEPARTMDQLFGDGF